uniref:Glucan endo-1,3-beta-D-glucosidase n=1 Tax=Leersia perrieri TaxID=77586 RepID=A0A0D9VA44_9ORYZ
MEFKTARMHGNQAYLNSVKMAAGQGVASLLAVVLVIGGFSSIPTVQSIGVCYGVKGNDLPSRSEVVQMYKSKGINGMRIYYPDTDALNALRNTGINLILDVADKLPYLAASPSNADAWVRDNVKPYYPAVNIRYITVGNEVEGGATNSILLAMRNVNAALASAGLGNIKASTAVKYDVIANSYPPSAGVFRDNYMREIARYLASTNAPLLANVYPYFAYRGNPRDISLNYATFQPGTTVKDPNSGLSYNNLFDAMMDAIYAALEKASAPNVRVVVAESGWPSAEGFGASMDNAKAYNQGLINHVGRGTPKRPGALEAFIFAMFNENQKPDDPTERHFGLFYPNKTPMAAGQGVASVLAAALVVGYFVSIPTVQSIGVCYGMKGNNLPSPSDVVKMYKNNGINKMRIYDPNKAALDALRNSGIDLILGVVNDDLPGIAGSLSTAEAWVENNVKAYYPAVNIKYITVGNEVSTVVQSNVTVNSYPPSNTEFNDGNTTEIARYLEATGAPLLANVYTYFAHVEKPEDVSLNYATFQPGPTTVYDNGFTYTNLFDAMVDAMYAALEKAGAPNVKVVVSESGWPSGPEGYPAATVENARIYNQGLINHVGMGTPRKKEALETYIFAMFNENLKTGLETEKHFGLFNPDTSPVYPIKF